MAFIFAFNLVLPTGYAQLIPASPAGGPQTLLNLPAPGTMVTPSAAFTPALINGITIHPENPLEFDFIVGTGDDKLQGKAFEEESTKLIKYFLASLTVPEDEMWVNLSPYEKDRIIPTGFGTTEMGRDLLAQDYILKQLTASLMYPEKELGKKFWDNIYRKAREQYGTTEMPVNTFNKVWIVPEKAVVYEHGNSAFVVKARLKVMLESDYEAMNDSRKSSVVSRKQESLTTYDLQLTTQIVKEIILPEIEKEVNEGKSFANLRQIYHSAILAAWFKQNLKQTLLGQVYVDKTKTKGIDVEDKTVNEKIYAQYLEAFKKGVYNYIKEDTDPATKEVIPRKYFSGGANLTSLKTKDVLETYEQPLTSLQRQIVDAILASPQQEVNIRLRELSQKTSAADVQKAVASSQQAALRLRSGLPSVASDEGRGTNEASSPIENIPRAVDALAGRDLKGVRVLIRANLNVTMTGDGDIPDTTRLKELDPIIKFLLERKADIILLGHNGRLEGSKDSRQSLRPLLEYFQLRFFRVPATLYEKSITAEGLQLKPEKLITNKYDEGSIHILQNVRFADRFENGKPGSPQREAFGRGLAELTRGDNGQKGILIVDAFGDIGSKGASIEDLPRHFRDMGGEVYAGPSMVKEFENFGQVLKQGIDVIIFGGVKSDKIEPLVRIVNHSLSPDGQIFLGSAPSAALAMGHPLLKNLMADNPGRVLTAVDYSNLQNTFDIGLQTRQLFLQKLDALRAGQTVLLNGTMGYVEEPSGQYKEGTKVIIEKLKELAGRGVRIIILGGDGGANAREYGLNKIENVSLITGGGVPLKILAGEELVGIKALQNAVSPAPVEEEISFPVDDEDAEPAQEFMPMAFLAPGRKVAVVLEGYWKAGGRSRISLQEISARTGLNKEFVLSAINGINGNFNSGFSIEPAGLNKRLDGQTQWIQLVARRPLGEFRQPSQGLQPRVRPASGGARPRPEPYGSGRASSPIEGLEVALIGGRKGDVADNLRLIGQLLAVNESSKILVGGATALAILEAKKMIDPGAAGVDKKVVEDARSYMNHYRVIRPFQVEVMDPENPASKEVIRVGTGKRVPRGKVIVGFGEQTIRTYADIISGSKSTFWNGPMDIDGTAPKIVEALAQAQRRGPLFVGEGSVGAAKAAGLTGSVYFSSNDFSKFLDDKAMKGGRGVTVSQQVKDRVPPEEVGGINLNPALLDLQIKRDGNGVPLPLPQQPLERMNIEGFIPVIINITPVTNLPLLLGLADMRQDEDETRPAMKAREPEEISVLN